MTTALTLDQFRATGRTVSLADFASIMGQDEADCLPGDATAVRLYDGNCWIVQVGPRMCSEHYKDWQLILETEEYHTLHDGKTLADLEAILFHSQDATPEAAFAAAEAEAHGLTDAPDPFDAPETCAHPALWNAPDETLHALVNPTSGTAAAYDRLAVALMETRPDLKQMSLDEWLVEHMDSLSQNERRAASAIIDLYHEKV